MLGGHSPEYFSKNTPRLFAESVTQIDILQDVEMKINQLEVPAGTWLLHGKILTNIVPQGRIWLTVTDLSDTFYSTERGTNIIYSPQQFQYGVAVHTMVIVNLDRPTVMSMFTMTDSSSGFSVVHNCIEAIKQ